MPILCHGDLPLSSTPVSVQGFSEKPALAPDWCTHTAAIGYVQETKSILQSHLQLAIGVARVGYPLLLLNNSQFEAD